MSRRRFLTALSGIGIEALWHAPSIWAADPVNTSSANLKVIALQVGAILEQHIATGYMPGAVALIGRGQKAELVGVGTMAHEGSQPMRRDSIFRIASMTKPITAAAAMMLVDEGALQLHEPIERWLPELARRRVLKRIGGPLHETVPANRPITLQDLLTFRCGLGVLMGPETYPIQQEISALKLVGFGPPDPASPLTPPEWLRRLSTLPLMAQPGEQWLYNTGSYILGVLLARVSGRSLPEFLQRRLFEPLHMVDTGFFVPEGKRARFTSAYRLEAGRPELYDAPASSAWNAAPAFPDAGAGLVSTADDFFVFANMLLTKGRARGRRLLSEASIAAMTTDQLTATQRLGGASILGDGRGWGLGMSVIHEMTAAGLPAGSYGWNGGLGTSWVTDPASGLIAILLTQTLFTSPAPPSVHQEIWRTVFSPSFL
jgi:CubicO group peptidase (beta-lactamase class C family)